MLEITQLTYTAIIGFLIVVILGPIFIPMLTKFKFFVQYRQKYLTYGSESITISKYGNSDEFAVFRAYCMNFMCLYCSLHIICTRPVRFCEGQLYFLSFRKSSFDCGVFGRFFPFIMNE